MSTQNIETNAETWTQIADGASALVIRVFGEHEIYLGSTAPADADKGFPLKTSAPLEIASVGALGGGAWVRALVLDGGSVTYASA